MSDLFKAIAAFFALILFCVGIAWIAQGSDFFLYRYFAPKYEDARRETFEHSHAYNQGMIQELQAMQYEYLKKTDAGERQAMASLILHRVGDYDETKLPPDLYAFVSNLRRHREHYPTTSGY